MVVGRLRSFCECLFSGDMLVLGRVFPSKVLFKFLSTVRKKAQSKCWANSVHVASGGDQESNNDHWNQSSKDSKGQDGEPQWKNNICLDSIHFGIHWHGRKILQESWGDSMYICANTNFSYANSALTGWPTSTLHNIANHKTRVPCVLFQVAIGP